uniref:Endonuclease/exonuclease/phosphatase domain-containing protein n=1 Tax=Odontella aurita TaxID=265563 RepID=A0A7S4N9S0_9STRA|mmetsp:Transcript_53899/g.161270  ORF Transcript_53899/g.161270 Transcript_53899/m.161270 type:complete len:400 (+) Transcript_53899:37-1236(+)
MSNCRLNMYDIGADVVCLQEVSPKSFEEDFAFMRDELGYDGHEMFKKGRFRPATFWKTSKLELLDKPKHGDRTLLTAFKKVEEGQGGGGGDDFHRNWHVLNCHLQAGPQGGRRVRQIHDGVDGAFKLAKKLKENDPANPLLVACGDFNGGSECGAVRYVEEGSIGPEFLEDGTSVTSKEKKMRLSSALTDAASAPELERGPAPATLVVKELISIMVEEGSGAYEEPRLSQDIRQRLSRIYARYATQNRDGEMVMGREDVERWLIAINGQVGRGSEFRTAAKQMGWKEPPASESDSQGGNGPKEKPRITLPNEGILSLDGFLHVYEFELRGGKFWGINYDLGVLGEPLSNDGVFKARYDRMYCSAALQTKAVLDTVSNVPCPNEHEPSDHLPVGALFECP